MAIEVINVPEAKAGLTADKMVAGVLYKLLDSTVSTVYLKLLDGRVVWFEPSSGEQNRANSAYTDGRLFVKAPAGTIVTIKN